MIRPLIIFCLFLLFSINAPAQLADTLCSDTIPVQPAIFEKIYLHLDRHFYMQGDNIWFKAYLINAQNNQLASKNSKTLYVELISPESKIIGREVLFLDSARATGDFKLSDSIAGGKYRIRAYTKWMLNFGDKFVFEKEIEVQSLSDDEKLGDLKPKKKNSEQKKEKAANPVANKLEIAFFPEGGAMIENVQGNVAFKVSDINGKGCNAKGKIVTIQGDTICCFEAQHLGMGKFSLSPQKGIRYFAVGSINNDSFKTELPGALPQGFALSIIDKDTAFAININTNETTFNEYANKNFLLSFEHCGKPMFDYKTNIDNLSKSLFFQKSFFPAGITRITLYDTLQKPQCERLVFIERNTINVNITSDTSAYTTNKKVILKIKINDQFNNPVKANLSLTVIDSAMIPNETFNIVTYLMLESEIQGTIEQALVYFDTTNTNRHWQLNLLLLTQGWRDFVWKHLADNSIDRIKFSMEQGLSITGSVRKTIFNRPLPGAIISMYFRDLDFENGGVRVTTTDSSGKYNLGNTMFYGHQRIVLTSKNLKNRDAGIISLDSAYMRTYPFVTAKPYHYGLLINPFPKDTIRNKSGNVIEIEEVKITATNYKKGKFLFKLQITPKDTVWSSLGNYICKLFPLTCFSPYTMPYNITRFNFWGIDGKRIYNISADEITMNEIEKLKIYEKHELGRDALGPTIKVRGIVIYTIDVYARYNGFTSFMSSSTNAIIGGYYKSRIFYKPKYDEKKNNVAQATHYWLPNIDTNNNGEATVTIDNTEKPYIAKVKVEGISGNGVPFVVISNFRVKE